jgi:capsular polysaccharide transport system permease protein
LLGAEGVVNRLNERSLRDTLSSAESEVARAQERLTRLSKDLTAFRQRERVIDPNRSSVAGLEITNRLAAELASLRAQRSELAAAAAESPQLPILDNRIRALAAQVAAEQSRVAGSGDSLAPKIGEFDQMTLQRQFADRQLASAMQSLEMARLEAQRQQLYLERISGPGTPDYPTQPNRLQGWLSVVVSLLLIYGVARFLTASLREHRQ